LFAQILLSLCAQSLKHEVQHYIETGRMMDDLQFTFKDRDTEQATWNINGFNAHYFCM
jgi:hypothetical protein